MSCDLLLTLLLSTLCTFFSAFLTQMFMTFVFLACNNLQLSHSPHRQQTQTTFAICSMISFPFILLLDVITFGSLSSSYLSRIKIVFELKLSINGTVGDPFGISISSVRNHLVAPTAVLSEQGK